MDLATAYLELEIAPGARESEVTEAFRLLAKVWHPDRLVDDPSAQAKATAKLARINAARQVIRAAGYPPPGSPTASRREAPSPSAKSKATPTAGANDASRGTRTKTTGSATDPPSDETDSGPIPCPGCRAPTMAAAIRCGRCWILLPPAAERRRLARAHDEKTKRAAAAASASPPPDPDERDPSRVPCRYCKRRIRADARTCGYCWQRLE